MNDNEHRSSEHGNAIRRASGDDEAFDRMLRRGAAHMDQALEGMLDVQGRLQQVKAGAFAARSPVRDADLERAVAVWRTELAAAVRGTDSTIHPVTDSTFFTVVTGRHRRGVEPWPEMQVSRSDGSPQQPSLVTLILCMPAYDVQRVAITALVSSSRWTKTVELLPARQGTTGEPDDVVELRGTLEVDSDQAACTDLHVELRAEH
ncbi:hypothetical protein ACF1A5_06105 [Streptomyces sp. NPDC014864]|uniref:hypothetical protein n=1 Tax=Streptomyces sp. NPDC014864 TaxID=3364924 RepID=UPI003702321F